MRSTALSLGAALLALACSGCDHSRAPASSASPAAATARAQPPAGGASTESAPPPAVATASTADTATKPAPPAVAPAVPVGAPVPGSPADVRRATVEETDALRQQGGVVIVDVRDQSSYDRAHIAGAVHIPLESIAARMNELPRDKPIVTYCA